MQVRYETQLGAPPALAFGALGEVLREIAAQVGAWRGFPLHIDLGDAGFPDVGYVSIPIALEVAPAAAGLQQLDLVVRSSRHPESFPTFTGALGIDGTGTSGAMLWLGGSYEVPKGGIGRFIDATVMRGVAQRTLENFLEDIAAACRARIDKRESEYARYHLFERGG